MKSKLMICDFTDMSFTTIDVAKRPNCPVCKGTLPPEIQEKLVWLCGRNTANINPETLQKINLSQVCESVQQLGFHVRVKSHLALVFDYKGMEVSLFNGGRMLIKNVETEKTALHAYKEIQKTLRIK